VILEELDEFWSWVRIKADQRDYEAMRGELVQVAACALRFAEQIQEHDEWSRR